jgi:hypothetical protein
MALSPDSGLKTGTDLRQNAGDLRQKKARKAALFGRRFPSIYYIMLDLMMIRVTIVNPIILTQFFAVHISIRPPKLINLSTPDHSFLISRPSYLVDLGALGGQGRRTARV